MNKVDKQELRRQAEAAISEGLEDGCRWALDINPAFILSMLTELDSLHGAIDCPDEITATPADDYETLRKQFMSLLTMANSKCRQVKHWRAQSSHIQQQEIWKNAANVNAERDTNAMLTDCLERAEAELEQYRKDAERYRALRSYSRRLVVRDNKCHLHEVFLDHAIDAELAKDAST